MTLAVYETLKVRAITWQFDFCGADYELFESCVWRENEIQKSHTCQGQNLHSLTAAHNMAASSFVSI